MFRLCDVDDESDDSQLFLNDSCANYSYTGKPPKAAPPSNGNL